MNLPTTMKTTNTKVRKPRASKAAKTTEAPPAIVEVPASESPIDNLNAVLDAADAVGQVRGAEKKKRQAVRKQFASATNRLIMETAKLLGLVKSEWKLGETRYVSIDMTKFDPKATGTPEEKGLFLGLRDRFESAGVHVKTFAFSEAGHVAAWGVSVDRNELKG
jgi:hypothetical protein